MDKTALTDEYKNVLFRIPLFDELPFNIKTSLSERRRKNELGQFYLVCPACCLFLGAGCVRCLERGKICLGLSFYMYRIDPFFLFHSRYVDLFGTSAYAYHGRDTAVVFFFSASGRSITYARWKYK